MTSVKRDNRFASRDWRPETPQYEADEPAALFSKMWYVLRVDTAAYLLCNRKSATVSASVVTFLSEMEDHGTEQVLTCNEIRPFSYEEMTNSWTESPQRTF